MKDNDQKLIWEAYSEEMFPSKGSREKGIAMELIKMYEGMIDTSVNMTDEQFEGLMMDKWKESINDPNTDEDQVLNHIHDQQDAIQPGTFPALFAMYRQAMGER